jgi:hypothetical protein
MFRFAGMIIVEVARLLLGVSLVLFCRPIANTILQQERLLDIYFRRRGLNLPSPLRDTTAETLYFFIGVFICLLEAFRIWTLMPS